MHPALFFVTFSLGLETTQVEEPPTKPIFKLGVMREPVTGEKKVGTEEDSEKGRCTNATLLDPCSNGGRKAVHAARFD